jgi:hypothetical protein
LAALAKVGKPEVVSEHCGFLRHKLCDEGKFVSRLHRIQISVVAIFFLLPLTSAVAAREATIHAKVSGACVGDTISGRVSLRAKGGTRFTLRLLKQQTANSGWTKTNLSRSFTSRGGSRVYRFRFNVSAFDAYGYRLGVYRRGQRVLSGPIAAASCAPGAQVPEAPLPLLLPLSLLATAAFVFRRRRSR